MYKFLTYIGFTTSRLVNPIPLVYLYSICTSSYAVRVPRARAGKGTNLDAYGVHLHAW